MKKISSEISRQILTIGPDYSKHRGGIGSVIEIYSKYFEDFKFLATYKLGSNIYNIFVFIGFIFKFILKLITDRTINVVHIHGASYGSFYRKYICFIIAKFLFHKKVIYHIHGAEFKLFHSRANYLTKKIFSYFINKVDGLICLSIQWQTFFESVFQPKSLIIVPNIIDYPSKNKRKSTSTGPVIFLFLGAIGNRKGVFDLLNVLSQRNNYYHGKIKLLIGGDGEVEKLKNVIAEKNLSGIVEYLGWVTKEKKIDCLQKCDVYILPSYNEGLPISILEAMSYGKPVISTNVGGVPEIVIYNRNGILIEPGNLVQLENSINFCIENRTLLNDYGNESKLIVKKHLPDGVIDMLVNVYSDMLVRDNTKEISK